MWYKGGYANWQRRILSKRTHHERHLRLQGQYPRRYEETLDQAIAILQRQGCVT
jgi:hypothetical protein